MSRGRCIAHGGGKRCVFEGCTTTARKGGFCFAHGGRSTTSSTSSRSKMVSPLTPFPSASPVTVHTKSRPWESAVRSPVPALTLPPRRQLPPLNAMLMANRPGILRRYTPVPPIRTPVVLLQRGANHAQHFFDRDWPETFEYDPALQRHQSSYPDFRGQAPQTPTSSSARAGYSWQRLQETIRRESRVHGITNDEDESAYEDKIICKVDDSAMLNDEVPMTVGGSYWTRSQGPIPY